MLGLKLGESSEDRTGTHENDTKKNYATKRSATARLHLTYDSNSKLSLLNQILHKSYFMFANPFVVGSVPAVRTIATIEPLVLHLFLFHI